MKILLCTGGTGGHIFPAKALSDLLIAKGHSVSVLLDKRAFAYSYVWDNKVRLKKIQAIGLHNKNVFFIIKMLLILGIGFLQSFLFILCNKPKVVVSFGGYTSLPVLLVCSILRIKFILHEQNAVMGKANRLFAKFAQYVALSFSNTKFVELYKNKVVVGLPVRDVFSKREPILHNDNNKFIISVFGGSLGANIFSENIPNAFLHLPLSLQQQIVVYHQCRKETLNKTVDVWKKTQVEFHVEPFFNNIDELMLRSDIIISRSGASTVFEIMALGKYAIYVPFAKASENHQYYNALNAKNAMGSDIILEHDFNPTIIATTLQNLLLNQQILQNKKMQASTFVNKNSTNEMYNLIITTVG
jgi:UDP-N-acetylglucosamine--N-acetylmuramyl-(pentapeptide) pyrophosphoryl-undecaprenol N-acetylglucosamine transferase